MAQNGTSSTSNVPLQDTGPSHALFNFSDVAGADAVVHTHPTDVNTAVAGDGDIDLPSLRGIPNYVAHGTTTIAIEISGGQVRARVVSGSLASTDRSALKTQLNSFQKQGKKR